MKKELLLSVEKLELFAVTFYCERLKWYQPIWITSETGTGGTLNAAGESITLNFYKNEYVYPYTDKGDVALGSIEGIAPTVVYHDPQYGLNLYINGTCTINIYTY